MDSLVTQADRFCYFSNSTTGRGQRPDLFVVATPSHQRSKLGLLQRSLGRGHLQDKLFIERHEMTG